MTATVIPTEIDASGTILKELLKGLEGARGVMVIVVGNGHGDTSSNPGRG